MRDIVVTATKGCVCIDTSYVPEKHPFWETMVFKANKRGSVTDWIHDLDVATYKTRDEAVSGHNAMVRKWATA